MHQELSLAKHGWHAIILRPWVTRPTSSIDSRNTTDQYSHAMKQPGAVVDRGAAEPRPRKTAAPRRDHGATLMGTASQ
jgi:hypothetical protein